MSSQGQIGYLTQLLAAMRQPQTESLTPAGSEDLVSVNVQPYDADLTAIAVLSGTSGLLRKTGLNTWTLDNSNYITTVTNSQVTAALGYTPVTDARTLTINGVTYDLTANRSWTIAGGVTSFNTRTGAITLLSSDITSTLGYTPYNAANPAGYISSFTETDPTVGSHIKAITITNISNWNTAYGWGNHALAGYLTGITSGQVTTALGYTPENLANKGVANGYASLDGSGLVPSTQLPSYVDDILEYTNLAGFPGSGTTGKIYVALDTNKIYRWSGSAYIEVSPTVGTIWGGITGTLANQTDLQTALDAKVPTVRTLTINGTTFDLSANRSWTINSMVYPSAGIAISTGTAWGTSITDNSANWNTAFSWGNHASAGYLTTSLAASTYLTISTAASTYQPLDADLTAIAGLVGTSGFLKKTAANTWSLDTNTYLTSFTEVDPFRVTAVSVSGTTTKTITITRADASTVTTTWTDYDTDTNTYVTSAAFTGGTLTLTRNDAGTVAVSLDGRYYLATNPSGYTSNTGTVTSVSGTGTVSGLSLSGTVTSTGNLTLAGTLAVTASNFSSQTANTFLAGPNGTAGIPTFRSIVAADIPTLNQNTSGSAGSVTNSLVLRADTGTTEGTDLYTYNGSAGKNLNIVAGSNITITKVAGQWTIAGSAGGTSLNGTGFVRMSGTTPSYITGTASQFVKADGSLDSTGYTTNTGTVTSVSGTGTVSGLTLTGTVTTSGSLTLGGTLSLTSLNVTTALGYTPYNATNPNGYITGYTETDTLASVTGRGATTTTAIDVQNKVYSRASQTDGNYTTAALWTQSFSSTTTGIAFHISGNVGKFLEMRTNGILYWEGNTVWTAGTLTNLNQLTNGPGYTTNTGTVTSVSGTGTVSGLTLSGSVTTSGSLTLGGTLSLTSGNVTTALGYTPYNSTNPNGYTTNTGTVTSVGGTGGYGGLTLSGTVTTSGNLTLGGTPTGTWPIAISGNAATLTGFTTQAGARYTTDFNSILTTGFFNAEATPTNSPGGSYGQLIVAQGIDTGLQIYGGYANDNLWFRGWHSSGTFYSWRTVLHNGNYNSYAPTLTGGGASGSWGISITGSAASITGVYGGTLTSSQITTGLGYTPYNSTNPSGYTSNTGTVTSVGGTGTVSGLTLTGTVTTSGNLTLGGTLSLTSANVTTALGYTPVTNARTLTINGTVFDLSADRSWTISAGTTLNGTGFVKASGTTISYDNSTYYLASNPSGYTTNTGTVTSVGGTGTVSGLTLTGTVTGSGNLTLGGTLSLTSGNVTTALGYTPYNSTNPSGYITSGGRAYPRRSDGGDLNFFWSGQSGQPPWLWGGSDGANMYVYNPSNFSVNYATSSGQVTINYNNDSNSTYQMLWGSGNSVYGTGGIYCNPASDTLYASLFIENSSVRFKENIVDLEGSLDKVIQMRGVKYNKKGTNFNQVGVIAEELLEILPEVVNHSPTGEVEGVAYARLTAVLIEAVKEQQKQIDELKQLLSIK